MADDVLIRVEGVSKKYCRRFKKSLWYAVKDTAADLIGRTNDNALRADEFWAVDDVSFELKRGECLGLIGRNGAGKTTLLKVLNGLIKPDKGRIQISGRVGAFIALGAGFNPILTGRENIYVNGAVLGLSKTEVDERYNEIVEFAEIDQFIDAPVQSYSSGMQVRLGFAVATALRPDVLLLDEVLAVGDAAFRAKCFQRVGNMLTNAAVIFVSHNEAQISRICDRAILLEQGQIDYDGRAGDALSIYRTNRNTRPKEAVVLNKRVESFEPQVDSRTVSWGGKLSVNAILAVSEEVRIGKILIHFWRDGDFVGNGEVSFSVDEPLVVPFGAQSLKFELGPLYLQQGMYFLSIAAFDQTKKKTVLHCFHFAEVLVDGPVGSGPTHLVPLQVYVANIDESA